MRRYSTAAFALPVLALTGCGRPPEPAQFSGHAKPPVAEAEDIREVSARPRGYETLGTVRSSCVARERAQELEDEWLKDVACSEPLLVRALREKAAEVGGEVLVARQCWAEKDEEDGVTLTERYCGARVARSKRTTRGLAVVGKGPEQRDDVLDLSARDAWRIRVDFTPADSAKMGRASRRWDLVDHLPRLTPSYVVYGDIVARCDDECARNSVKEAVRAAAARVGADGVTGIECAEKQETLTCSGHAAVYATDPQTHPAAR